MKKFIGLILLLYLCRAGTGQSLSPAVIAASGDVSSSQGVSVSWTLGEIMTNTYQVPDVILTQGFQQPTYSYATIAEGANVKNRVKVYPVPAGERLHIDASGLSDVNGLRVIMYDLQGKRIMDETKNDPVFIMNMQHLSPGAYMIEVFDQANHFIKSMKITKK